MLGDAGGDGATKAARLRGSDALVLTAAGLTLAALLSITAQVLTAVSYHPLHFGDRVLEFAVTGPYQVVAYLLLILAALALACVVPTTNRERRLIDGLRAAVALVAAVGVVEFAYATFVYATKAAIGHTQLLSNFGTAARVEGTGYAGAELLLVVCALWLVTRPTSGVDATDAPPLARVSMPSWSTVAGTVILTLLAAFALVELVVEPVFRATGQPITTRLDPASLAFGSYPIALLAFAVVAMIVAARHRREHEGVTAMAAAATIGVLGVAAAVFGIYRTLIHHAIGLLPGLNPALGRASAITTAAASGIVAALAWLIAVKFGRPDRGEVVHDAATAYRAPSVASLRVAAMLVAGSAVGFSVFIVAAALSRFHPGFGDLVSELASQFFVTGLVALGAALLAHLAGFSPARALLGLIAIGSAGCEAYAVVYVLAAHHAGESPLSHASSLFQHQLAAQAGAAVLVALAVLGIVVSRGDDDPDYGDEPAAGALEVA